MAITEVGKNPAPVRSAAKRLPLSQPRLRSLAGIVTATSNGNALQQPQEGKIKLLYLALIVVALFTNSLAKLRNVTIAIVIAWPRVCLRPPI